MALVRTETEREFRVFVDGNYIKSGTSIHNPENFTFEFEDNETIMLIFTYRTFKEAFIVYINESKNEINLPCTAIKGEIYLHVKRSNVGILQKYISILKVINDNSLNLDKAFYRKLELVVLNRKFKGYYVDRLFAEYRKRETWGFLSKLE